MAAKKFTGKTKEQCVLQKTKGNKLKATVKWSWCFLADRSKLTSSFNHNQRKKPFHKHENYRIGTW